MQLELKFLRNLFDVQYTHMYLLIYALYCLNNAMSTDSVVLIAQSLQNALRVGRNAFPFNSCVCVCVTKRDLACD